MSACAPLTKISGRASRPTCIAPIAVALLVAALPGAAQVPAVAPAPTAIAIEAQPITAFDIRDHSRRQFGSLHFRGGLVLRSVFPHFGGLSAIRVAADGARFIALSDKGWWLRGRLTYEDARPSAIVDAEMAPILGADGRPLAERGWYDTESIAEDGGTLYVGVERVNQIVRFDYGKDGLAARGEPIAVPPGVRTLPSNKGLETLVFVPKGLPLAGTLIAISERGLDKAGNIIGFLIDPKPAARMAGGAGKAAAAAPGTFAVRRSAAYDISDAALLPGGDLLLLERKFSWTSGLFLRMRRIALAEIRPGALVDGPVLLEADLGYEIDNMEGLSVHPGPNGEIVLTLVSDDNFSVIQRTLLLQFTLGQESGINNE